MREKHKPQKARYQHKAPKFRPTPSPREQLQWRHTVYYWWWRYLRLNDDYRRCCEKGGRGSMRRLYKDFGNVFDTDDFKTWWLDGKRGESLFAEPAQQVTMRVLRNVREWDETWKRNEVIVVSVPLSDPKWRLARSFAALLKECKTGEPSEVTKARSEATYSVSGQFSCEALEKMCKVYELKKANDKMVLRGNAKHLPLYLIGKKAGIIIKVKKGKDELDSVERMRNVMSATVCRYLKKANTLIENVGRGHFPCFDE